MPNVYELVRDHMWNLRGWIQSVTAEQWVIAAAVFALLAYGFVRKH